MIDVTVELQAFDGSGPLTVTELKRLDDGSVETDSEGNNVTYQKPWTVREVLVNALLAPASDIEGTEKMRRFILAKEVQENDSVEFKAEDIALVKTLVGEGYASVVVGQVWPLLDRREERRP